MHGLKSLKISISYTFKVQNISYHLLSMEARLSNSSNRCSIEYNSSLQGTNNRVYSNIAYDTFVTITAWIDALQ